MSGSSEHRSASQQRANSRREQVRQGSCRKTTVRCQDVMATIDQLSLLVNALASDETFGFFDRRVDPVLDRHRPEVGNGNQGNDDDVWEHAEFPSLRPRWVQTS